MPNIDFCALGQLDRCKKSTKDGAVAIETVRRGYSDVQEFMHGYSDI